MRYFVLLVPILLGFASCQQEDKADDLDLLEIKSGDISLSEGNVITENVPVDRTISLLFSTPLDATSLSGSFILSTSEKSYSLTPNLLTGNTTVNLQVQGAMNPGEVHKLEILSTLKSTQGMPFPGTTIQFKTVLGNLEIETFSIKEAEALGNNLSQKVPVDFEANLTFNYPIDPIIAEENIKLDGPQSNALSFSFSEENRKVTIQSESSLEFISKYTLQIGSEIRGSQGEKFNGTSKVFYTQIDPSPKFPFISEEELLTKVQRETFRYFWDFAHPVSGMSRERNTSGNTVTTGGTGFGLMTWIVGVERGWISREQAVEKWSLVVNFLKNADRFHGVWSHWINGETGKAIAFSAKDNGGDLVETAFLIQSLLTVQEYLNPSNPSELALSKMINQLWEEVEWDWYTREGQNVLYWHWSPEFNWEMNMPISGYNEALIVYVLAVSSPTHPISKEVYEQGWARSGDIKNNTNYYGYNLPLGVDYGGPLFFAHYSFLGLDPRNLQDQYANYWNQNVQHSLINHAHAIANPKFFVGYSDEIWGFTASDNPSGYGAQSPSNDSGVITPTAALSSFPYTPDESMKALEAFYYRLGDKTWGDYGFYDSFDLTKGWYADSYLAIDQGPIVIMIENHRSGLLWDLFMKNPQVQSGLTKLGFTY